MMMMMMMTDVIVTGTVAAQSTHQEQNYEFVSTSAHTHEHPHTHTHTVIYDCVAGALAFHILDKSLPILCNAYHILCDLGLKFPKRHDIQQCSDAITSVQLTSKSRTQFISEAAGQSAKCERLDAESV